MMKITGLCHLLKWENLHNWWLTKYFFAPLYIQPTHLCATTIFCIPPPPQLLTPNYSYPGLWMWGSSLGLG